MKVPISWLSDYISIDLPPAELARRLTMAGTEVSAFAQGGDRWQGVVIGQIVAISPHPNADRLRLVTVDPGAEEQTVVCGAPNLNLGDKIAFASAGVEIIDGHSGEKVILKPARIRGVTSAGMVLSEKELGISDSHEGIMVLPPEAPVGKPLADFLSDTTLDLEVTPNRPDLLSVIGVAREVAALTSQSVCLPEAVYEEMGPPVKERVSVEITAPDLCPRYCASLITGIKIAQSPEWLKQRLLSCGMRPINNVVDVTNYIMLEYGQPLHGFDFDKVEGSRVIVRRAYADEVIVSLDGVGRTLSEDTLVIADEERAIAIAGVMGGANSEVSEETTSVLLESASFNPASIHYTSRGLRLVSEASIRFERAIRSELTLPALKWATQLILRLAGGMAARGLVDVYPGKKGTRPILMRVAGVKRLLGVDFGQEQMVKTLTSLGFEMKTEATGFLVTPPYWRSDISLEADLVEEVARITGYDRIPATMLSSPLPKQNPEPVLGLKRKIRQALAGCGFQEVITYSLTSREILEKIFATPDLEPKPLHLANPMTADQEYLRTSLRGSVLSALAANTRREDGVIKLFELARVYLPRDNDLPAEPEFLCGLLTGGMEKSWPGSEEPVDFFAVKGVVEGLLTQFGVAASFELASDPGLRPGRQAAVFIDNIKLGVLGELNPRVAQAFDISREVYLFEIDVAALLPHTLGYETFQPLPRFPSVVRDIALVVDAKITHRQIVDIITGFPLVDRVILFDVYTGKQVPQGKKSLAYHIGFQSETHTLTDEEADKVQQQILDRLSAELGASLRG